MLKIFFLLLEACLQPNPQGAMGQSVSLMSVKCHFPQVDQLPYLGIWTFQTCIQKMPDLREAGTGMRQVENTYCQRTAGRC